MLAGLAIYRQIRDFGLLFGDGKFELAIYRQSPKFRDFEPGNWRNRRNLNNSGDFGDIASLADENQHILRVNIEKSAIEKFEKKVCYFHGPMVRLKNAR